MKKFGGYDDAKKQAQASGVGKLPAGGYVCRVIGVKYTKGEEGKSDFIEIQFEIAEGEYAGFFQKQYEANTNEDKKYKGRTKIYVPNDDGSEKDGWTKKSFASWTNAFEESNEGYLWDWDEKKWKGKLVGIIFGETGTVIGGREVVYTEARFATSAEKIRSGNYREAKFKAKDGYTGSSSSSSGSDPNGFMDIPEGAVEDLPFD